MNMIQYDWTWSHLASMCKCRQDHVVVVVPFFFGNSTMLTILMIIVKQQCLVRTDTVAVLLPGTGSKAHSLHQSAPKPRGPSDRWSSPYHHLGWSESLMVAATGSGFIENWIRWWTVELASGWYLRLDEVSRFAIPVVLGMCAICVYVCVSVYVYVHVCNMK